jgi:rhodanese-related sulfurtransferase
VAQTLLDEGWTDVHPLEGGFDAWRGAGYAVEPKRDAA